MKATVTLTPDQRILHRCRPMIANPVSDCPTGANSPWDAALAPIERFYPIRGKVEALEPGVNFFVLALESLGAKTIASCEGHPKGFYILFEAPYEVAMRIQQAGYFSVALSSAANQFCLSLSGCENGCRNTRRKWTESVKRRILRSGAEAWKTRMLNGHKKN